MGKGSCDSSGLEALQQALPPRPHRPEGDATGRRSRHVEGDFQPVPERRPRLFAPLDEGPARAAEVFVGAEFAELVVVADPVDIEMEDGEPRLTATCRPD